MDQCRDYYQGSLVLSRNTFKFLQGVFEPALRSRNVKTPTNTPTHPCAQAQRSPGDPLAFTDCLPWSRLQDLLPVSPGQAPLDAFGSPSSLFLRAEVTPGRAKMPQACAKVPMGVMWDALRIYQPLRLFCQK